MFLYHGSNIPVQVPQILSECEYDGLTFLSCLTKTAMEDSQSKKRGGWCNAYVDGLVEKCKAEAKLVVPLK